MGLENIEGKAGHFQNKVMEKLNRIKEKVITLKIIGKL